MTSIIEELYYGNINPNERHYTSESPFMQAVQLRKINLDKLMGTLNEQEKELFEKYCGAHDEIEDITRYDTFTYALKFGVLLMAEVFAGMNEVSEY